MMNPQQQEITPQNFGQSMGQLKRRIAQVQGEAQQMNADTISSTLEQIMSMVNQLFQVSSQKDQKIQEIQKKLDNVYNAHPELKIADEAAAKEQAEKAAKKAKKV